MLTSRYAAAMADETGETRESSPEQAELGGAEAHDAEPSAEAGVQPAPDAVAEDDAGEAASLTTAEPSETALDTAQSAEAGSPFRSQQPTLAMGGNVNYREKMPSLREMAEEFLEDAAPVSRMTPPPAPELPPMRAVAQSVLEETAQSLAAAEAAAAKPEEPTAELASQEPEPTPVLGSRRSVPPPMSAESQDPSALSASTLMGVAPPSPYSVAPPAPQDAAPQDAAPQDAAPPTPQSAAPSPSGPIVPPAAIFQPPLTPPPPQVAPAPPLSAEAQLPSPAATGVASPETFTAQLLSASSSEEGIAPQHADWMALARRKEVLIGGGVVALLLAVVAVTTLSGDDDPSENSASSAVVAEPERGAVEEAASPAAEAPKAPSAQPAATTPRNAEEEPQVDKSDGEETNNGDVDEHLAVRPQQAASSCNDALGEAFKEQPEPHAGKSGAYWNRSRKSLLRGKGESALKQMCLAASWDIAGRGTYGLSEHYFKQSDFVQALQWAQRVPEKSRRHGDAQAMIGDIYSQQGRSKPALDAYLKHWNIDKDDQAERRDVAARFVNSATSARYKRDWWTAERYYRRAVSLDPQSSPAAAGLARTFAHFELPKAAAHWAERALQQDPESVEAAIGACEAELLEKNAEGAKRALERLEKLSPGNPQVAGLSRRLLQLD